MEELESEGDGEEAVESEEESLRELTSVELGRAAEPAQVRYARLAERRKSTGQSLPPPPPPLSASTSFQSTERSFSTTNPATTSHNGQNTTVNIATAFAQAVRKPLKPPVGAGNTSVRGSTSAAGAGTPGRRAHSPFLSEALRAGNPGSGPRVEPGRTLSSILREQEEAEAEAMEAGEESEGSGKETHEAGRAAGEGSVKKRKVSLQAGGGAKIEADETGSVAAPGRRDVQAARGRARVRLGRGGVGRACEGQGEAVGGADGTESGAAAE